MKYNKQREALGYGSSAEGQTDDEIEHRIERIRRIERKIDSRMSTTTKVLIWASCVIFVYMVFTGTIHRILVDMTPLLR